MEFYHILFQPETADNSSLKRWTIAQLGLKLISGKLSRLIKNAQGFCVVWFVIALMKQSNIKLQYNHALHCTPINIGINGFDAACPIRCHSGSFEGSVCSVIIRG